MFEIIRPLKRRISAASVTKTFLENSNDWHNNRKNFAPTMPNSLILLALFRAFFPVQKVEIFAPGVVTSPARVRSPRR